MAKLDEDKLKTLITIFTLNFVMMNGVMRAIKIRGMETITAARAGSNLNEVGKIQFQGISGSHLSVIIAVPYIAERTVI